MVRQLLYLYAYGLGADRFPQPFAKAVSSPDRDSHKRINLTDLIIRE